MTHKCSKTVASCFITAALMLSSTPLTAIAASDDTHPDFSKSSTVNADGSVTVRLDIKGKAIQSTTTTAANLIVLYDVSASMQNFMNVEKTDLYKNVIHSSRYRYFDTLSYDVYAIINDHPVRLNIHPDSNLEYIDSMGYSSSSREAYPAANDTIYFVRAGQGKTRIDTANAALVHMADTLLADNSRTSITVIPFSGTSYASRKFVAGQKQDLVNYLADLKSRYVYGNAGASGTNWENAYNAALNSINSDSATLPQNVALITDGQPTVGAGSANGNISTLSNYINNNIKNKSNFKYLFYVYTAAEASSVISGLSSGTRGTLYNATNPSSIQTALDDIAKKVQVLSTFNNVSVVDTLSTSVHFPVTDGSAAPNFKYYKNGQAWSGAPAAKILPQNNEVQWDLQSVGTLDPNTTYSLEFTILPNKAELDNAAEAAANGKAAVISSTNDAANVIYRKTTQVGDGSSSTESGTYALPTQPTIEVPYSILHVQATFEGTKPTPDSVDATVYRDGAVYKKVTLTKASGYSYDLPASIDHTYRVVEATSAGFSATNPADLTLSGAPKQTQTMTIANVTSANKLRVLYNDTTGGKTSPLANGRFTVTNAAGASFELTTDATGLATSENPLEDGTYTISQSYVPAGYQPLSGTYTLTVAGDIWTLTNGSATGTVSSPEDGIKQITFTTQKIISQNIPSTGGQGLWIYIAGICIAVASIAFVAKQH